MPSIEAQNTYIEGSPVTINPSQVAAAMFAHDHATQALGIVIESIGAGTATLSMRVRRDMLNGHQMAHGGLMYTLCDTAFAYACNSYNVNTVAAGCSIEYLLPAFEGDLLTATATECVRLGRQGVYDVSLSRTQAAGAPELIALFRGKSATIRGHIVAIEAAAA